VPTFVKPSTWEKVLNFIASQNISTPYLLVDTDIIREKASILGKNITNASIFYAVKAHPDIEIVRFIDNLGLNFEISSEGELKILRDLGVEPHRIISSNPLKSPPFISQAWSYGVKYFAFDSQTEVDKLALHAPSSSVYVRLAVPNEGSEWPLSRKFGVEPDEAVDLLFYAKSRGINPVGVKFHVGSQCTNVYNWTVAIDKVKLVWERCQKMGIDLNVLNVGGGYPIRYTKDVVGIQAIEEMMSSTILRTFSENMTIHIEPGRAVVGDAGMFVASVIGKAERSGENWLYIDVGVFNGLMESIGGIRYRYVVGSRSEPKKWTIAGPSCDSFDVIDRDVELPEPTIGDRLLILSAGAYTISYASEFNGFPVPKTILI
jgi:ornithine decarboxylase